MVSSVTKTLPIAATPAGPEIATYDVVVVAFSGDKDSLACLLHLLGSCSQQLRGAKGHYERVPYDNLDPMEMCEPCAALWHVTIATMLLHEHARWEAIEEMERTRRPRQEDL